MSALEKIIKTELKKLPKWCKTRYPVHYWINVYNPPLIHKDTFKNMKVVLEPYQMCRHCHARQEIA